ncbi:hypothetical protein PILCRDRAFT_813129 [Piloderma croceum F 1598]|uniref:Uncharacterized protein n=1 Tax=Piloderma croceum (strain F 1598) TaxID=765440 RepID=A0A0C3BRS5_PILCF|nr:hypothetical protein PILCRDRAFT_813129 [Piloderma croceum F 1598]
MPSLALRPRRLASCHSRGRLSQKDRRRDNIHVLSISLWYIAYHPVLMTLPTSVHT